MKTKSALRRSHVLLLILGGLLIPVTRAQAEEGDPPTRVARISYLHGAVSFQPGGAGDWGSAVVNRPMTVGDRIWTDSDARAELQAGAAAIHLNGRTALSFLNLDDRTTQMRVAEGTVNFRVRELRSDDLYEVDAPNLAFTVTHAGAYRVDVNETGDSTEITVFRGEGEITASGRTYKVREGERAEFTGAENLQYHVGPAPRPDKFDRWAMERDLRGERSVSHRYVSRDVIGYEDLDDYGYWRDAPGYGPVWYPYHVDAGWAPYRYGYWGWVDPWGWTWIDYAPWGFAPFHYGRWAFFGGVWGWVPGPVFVRPVYAPAFVAFFGGPHFGFGFGSGFIGVGWFPLGFGEPFFPWFRASSVFIVNVNITNTVIRNVNIIHTTSVRNVNFVNAHNVRAVTVVPQRAFVNAEAVNRAALRVSPEVLRNAEVTTRASFTPTSRSVLGASAGAHVATPPLAVQNRAVFTRTTPAAAAVNVPVRPANPGAVLSAHTQLSGPASPVQSRPAVPDAAPMSPRQGELAQDKPQRFGENNHDVMSRPQARGQGDVRSGVPQAEERIHQRPADRPVNRPSALLQSRPVNPNRPPETPRGVPDRNPMGRELGRPSDMPQRSAPSSAQPVPHPAPRSARMTQADRPPWARGGGSGVPDVRPQSNGERNSREMTRPSSPARPERMDRPSDRPASQPHFEDRRTERPSRSFEPPRSEPRPAPSNERGFRAPEPRYSAPEPRHDSAPRSYSAPQRSYSAPSRSYGGSRSYSAPRGSSGGSPRGSSSSFSGSGRSGQGRR